MRTAFLAVVPLLLCFHCGDEEPTGAAPNQRPSPEAGVEHEDAGAEPSDAGSEPDAGDPGAFPEALDTIELGEVDASGPITFELPANVAGFQIVARREASNEPFRVRSLRSPNGQAIIENNEFAGTGKVAYEALSVTTLATTVPQHGTTDGLKPPAGSWTLRLAGADGDVNVRILLRRTEDGTPKPGLLDLKLYIPQGLELDDEKVTVSNAETSEPVQIRLAAFDAELESLYGVRLGRVQYAQMSSRFRHMEENFFEAGLDTEGDGKLLHLVFSEETSSFWGISGGIPGAIGTSGAENSVFALNSLWRPLAQEQGIDYETIGIIEGAVLAHEAGHFLGLFHSTELDGYDADPLDDTPECPGDTIQDYDQIESCPDYPNVMFPSSQYPTQVASPLQKRVVQGSSLLRGFSTGGALRMRRPAQQAPQHKPGILFHAPGKDLTPAQRAALSATCGTGTHRVPLAKPALRAELEAIAADTTLPQPFRRGAERALGR